MWDVILRRWVDLLFWWMPRKEGAPTREPEQAPSRKPEEGEPRAAAAPEQPVQRPQQAEGGRPKAAEPSARPAARPATAQPAPAAKASAARAAESSARPAAEPTAQPEKTVAPPVPDDLTEIKGIGPAMQNKLRALGITTFADLAAADPDQLMAQLKGAQPLSRGRVRHWTEAARQRART